MVVMMLVISTTMAIMLSLYPWQLRLQSWELSFLLFLAMMACGADVNPCVLVGHIHRLKIQLAAFGGVFGASDHPSKTYHVSGCYFARRTQAETELCEEKVEDVSNEDPGHLCWGRLGNRELCALTKAVFCLCCATCASAQRTSFLCKFGCGSDRVLWKSESLQIDFCIFSCCRCTSRRRFPRRILRRFSRRRKKRRRRKRRRRRSTRGTWLRPQPLLP